MPGQVCGELGFVIGGVVVVVRGDLDGEVGESGRVEVDDARFDVVAGVDEGEVVGSAAGEGVGVAGVCRVEDVGDGG